MLKTQIKILNGPPIPLITRRIIVWGELRRILECRLSALRWGWAWWSPRCVWELYSVDISGLGNLAIQFAAKIGYKVLIFSTSDFKRGHLSFIQARVPRSWGLAR
jgi:hypothetical protein